MVYGVWMIVRPFFNDESEIKKKSPSTFEKPFMWIYNPLHTTVHFQSEHIQLPFMSASLRGRLCSVWRRAVRCIAGADWQADVAPILKNHRLTHIEHHWALQIALVTRRCIQRSGL